MYVSLKSIAVTIQYLTNGHSHIWATIGSLSLKVSKLTAPQTHTTPILSAHKKSVDFPALEKSGKLICYIWQQPMTGEQSRYYCKIFQLSARIISLQIMWLLSYMQNNMFACYHGYGVGYKQTCLSHPENCISKVPKDHLLLRWWLT